MKIHKKIKIGTGYKPLGLGPGGSRIDMVYVGSIYMCLPFRALFREIWYSDRGVFIRDE